MDVQKITDDNYQAVVGVKSGLVLVNFFASWCAQCRMLKPVLEQVSEARQRVGLFQADVEDCPAITNRYEVHNVPSLVLLKDGRPVDRLVNTRSKGAILAMIDRFV